MDAYAALTFIAALGLIACLLWRRLRPRLKPRDLHDIRRAWRHARSEPDPVRQVMEGDKALDLLLSRLGYRGTLGEKLKKAGRILPNENAVWNAHKLRNRLAHEPGAQAGQSEAQAAMVAFSKALGKFVDDL